MFLYEINSAIGDVQIVPGSKEARMWRERYKDVLATATCVRLVPLRRDLPNVLCPVPNGATAEVFRRVYGRISGSNAGEVQVVTYCVGYRLNGVRRVMQVFPSGNVLLVEEPYNETS